MADVAKLKKRAAEYEQRKQFDKALAEYQRILDLLEDHVDEADVALYNRVGDLLLRQGSTAQAIQYYERAVDLYTEGGFFNNAIALCNKILRNTPGHSAVYYKLGKISARKGFTNDAKQHFLEYADRMQREGRLEEAFRALKEFADLCPDQDDIRLMLADQLVRKGRQQEAIEQLQTLYERYVGDGRDREARATLERMRSIDPDVELRQAPAAPEPKRGGLVFLDLGATDTEQFGAPGAQLPFPRDGHAAELPPLEIMGGLESEGLTGLIPGARLSGEMVNITPPSGSLLSGYQPTGMGNGIHMPAAGAPTRNGANGGRGYGAPTRPEPPRPGGKGWDAIPGKGELKLIFPEDLPEPDHRHDFVDVGPSGPIPEPVAPPSAAVDLPPALAGLNIVSTRDDLPDLAPAAKGPPSGELEIQLEQAAFLDSTVSLVTPAPGMVAIPQPLSLTPPAPIESLSGEGDGFDEFDSLDEVELIVDPGFSTDESAPRAGAGAEVATGPEAPASMPELSSRFDSLSGIENDEELPPLELDDEPARSFDELSIAVRSAEPEPVADLLHEEPRSLEPGTIFGVDSDSHQAFEALALVTADRTSGNVRRVTPAAVDPLDALRTAVVELPGDGGARVALARGLMVAGMHEEARRELEASLPLFEAAHDLAAASEAADMAIELAPDSLQIHRKRVEYAVRRNERDGVVERYLGLADCLLSHGQRDKARAIYGRVLELAPGNARAHAVLAALATPTPPSGSPQLRAVHATSEMKAIDAILEPGSAPGSALPTPVVSAPDDPAPHSPAPGTPRGDDHYVKLSDWLREDEAVRDTRMVVSPEQAPAQQEVQVNEVLTLFKEGVARTVDEDDAASHYDLGIAYRGMGLLDDAIGEFQKALRGRGGDRVRAAEALGECFLEKRQPQFAIPVLEGALAEAARPDDSLIGVLYQLGTAYESLGRHSEALGCFQRVFAVDIRFRDVGERMSGLHGEVA